MVLEVQVQIMSEDTVCKGQNCDSQPLMSTYYTVLGLDICIPTCSLPFCRFGLFLPAAYTSLIVET